MSRTRYKMCHNLASHRLVWRLSKQNSLSLGGRGGRSDVGFWGPLDCSLPPVLLKVDEAVGTGLPSRNLFPVDDAFCVRRNLSQRSTLLEFVIENFVADFRYSNPCSIGLKGCKASARIAASEVLGRTRGGENSYRIDFQ